MWFLPLLEWGAVSGAGSSVTLWSVSIIQCHKSPSIVQCIQYHYAIYLITYSLSRCAKFQVWVILQRWLSKDVYILYCRKCKKRKYLHIATTVPFTQNKTLTLVYWIKWNMEVCIFGSGLKLHVVDYYGVLIVAHIICYLRHLCTCDSCWNNGNYYILYYGSNLDLVTLHTSESKIWIFRIPL